MRRKPAAILASALLALPCAATACRGPAGPEPTAASRPADKLVPPADGATGAATPALPGEPREGGVRVERLVAGAGPSAVAPGSILTIRYRGALEDGTVFAEATTPPAGPWPLAGLVKGLRVGLLGMQVGEKRRIVVPPALGYGDQPVLDEANATLIPGGATLVFTVELLELETAADRAGDAPRDREGEGPPHGPAAEHAERAR